jgi:hypothetical protein
MVVRPAYAIPGQSTWIGGRIGVRSAVMSDQTLRNDPEDRARNEVVESSEGRTRLRRDGNRRTDEGRVLDRIEIHANSRSGGAGNEAAS